jgi:hypothetical protein
MASAWRLQPTQCTQGLVSLHLHGEFEQYLTCNAEPQVLPVACIVTRPVAIDIASC